MSSPMQVDTLSDNMSPLLNHLIKRPCSDIRPRVKNRTKTMSEFSGAITVKDCDPLHAIYAKLNENNILACPVVSTMGNNYLGVISMPMIVHWVIENFDTRWGRTTSAGNWSTDFTKERRWKETTAFTLLQSIPRRNQPAVSKDNSLFFAFELLARQNMKLTAIVEPVGRHVTGVFTQSMAIGEVYNKMMDGTIAEAAKKTKVRDLNGSWIVASVRERQLAITAFRMMKEKHYNGVAVVDETGRLTDVLSTRDMKGITNGELLFSRLYLTVKDFKAKVRSEHQPNRGRPIVGHVQCATRDTTLFDAVKLMDEKNLHRLVIVDSMESMIPIQMLSAVDILRSVLPNPTAYTQTA